MTPPQPAKSSWGVLPAEASLVLQTKSGTPWTHQSCTVGEGGGAGVSESETERGWEVDCDSPSSTLGSNMTPGPLASCRAHEELFKE